MATPSWKRNGQRSSAAPSPAHRQNRHDRSRLTGVTADSAMWASPTFPRARSHPSNLHTALRSSPSFVLSRTANPMMPSKTTRATQTETNTEEMGEIHLGRFGSVDKMTIDTVDFLLRVLQDRKQELAGSEVYVRAEYAGVVDDHKVSETEQRESSALEFHATNGEEQELVRSHSHEALVQLEEILEARHHQLMNDGLLERRHD